MLKDNGSEVRVDSETSPQMIDPLTITLSHGFES